MPTVGRDSVEPKLDFREKGYGSTESHPTVTGNPQFPSNPVKPSQTQSKCFSTSIVGASLPLASLYVVDSLPRCTTNGGLPLRCSSRGQTIGNWQLPTSVRSDRSVRSATSPIRNPQSAIGSHPVAPSRTPLAFSPSTYFHLIPLNSTYSKVHSIDDTFCLFSLLHGGSLVVYATHF
jgi:hypothetical protein